MSESEICSINDRVLHTHKIGNSYIDLAMLSDKSIIS